MSLLRILLCFVLTIFVYSGTVKPDNQQCIQQFNNAILVRHNYYRAKHGVPNLQQENNLVSIAQRYAKTIAQKGYLVHSNVAGLGENLHMVSNSDQRQMSNCVALANKAVDDWYNEIKLYNFNNPSFSSGTGHFTQVVWKNTNVLGCGIAFTDSYYGNFKMTAAYTVCNYRPPGNYNNDYRNNVFRPKNRKSNHSKKQN